MDTQALAVAQEIDFSTLALFARATLTVKIVMLLLLAISFWSWSIALQKYLQLRRERRLADAFDRVFWSGNPLDELYEQISAQETPKGASERIFVAAMLELQRSHAGSGALIPGACARIERAMSVAISREAERLTKGLSFLATAGATAPFIGLFGTIWGIKHSFEQIAISQNTNLAVVAPGIAEALLATGIGLVAAIPAVIFYNKFNADSEAILSGYDSFSDEFATILSRQLDG